MNTRDQPKRIGRPPMPPEAKRTGRLPFRVRPDVEAKAKRMGRDWLERLILGAVEQEGRADAAPV